MHQMEGAAVMNWNQVLTQSALQELAGSRSYADGVRYAGAGAVSDILVGDHTITAQVQGSERYRVRLDFDENESLSGDCTCPFAAQGNFCKHCVALGIAYLKAESDPASTAKPVKLSTVQAHLENCSREQLIALVLEQVKRDPELKTRLMLDIAQSGPNGPDLNAYRKSIDRAIAIPGYLDYDDVGRYADGIETVVVSLTKLLERGFAKQTRELAEYAIDKLTSKLDQIDDSNGDVGGVWQDLHQVHLDSTLEFPDDPTILAEWVFNREMTHDWDLDVGYEEYLPALGTEGEEHFRRLAEAQWASIPQLNPGDRDSYNGQRYAITSLMLRLNAGDLPGIVAIKQRNLSLAYHFLEVAELYQKSGDSHSALEWAEQGRVSFPKDTDSRLLDFLVEQYTEHERFAEAYSILWERFKNRMSLTQYQMIYDYAKARGDWDEWRARSWNLLRTESQRREPVPGTGVFLSRVAPDHSLLVAILLWEGRNDEAWDEAQAGGCSGELWLRLAQTREESHPDDAMRLYRDEIEKQLAVISNGDYVAPIRYLRKVREIAGRTGQEDRLVAYIQRLRAEYKRKRNFMKLLDENRFPA